MPIRRPAFATPHQLFSRCTRVSLCALLAAIAGPAPAAPAPSEVASFPGRPMRIVVGFSAGSVVDISARIVGQKLFEKWQQQVIVDNRPSAGGIIAAQLAAGAIADGYTLLSVSASHAVAPAIYAKLPYDTISSFTDRGPSDGETTSSAGELTVVVMPAKSLIVS